MSAADAAAVHEARVIAAAVGPWRRRAAITIIRSICPLNYVAQLGGGEF